MLRSIHALLLAALLPLLTVHAADRDDAFLQFEDTMLEEALVYPEWFKISAGDLNDDLQEAVNAGKSGIMVYFGQKRCSYCEQFLNENLGNPEIQHYIREHYDIIPVDIWGIEDIIDTDGETYSERELSLRYKTNFTPSLVFYDSRGKPVFRLRGYYPPYKFAAALRYVTEGFYRDETFRDYLARAEPDMFFTSGGLMERDFFMSPPFRLDRSIQASDKPLAVFFEQGNCHACELLHSGPLTEDEILKEVEQMDMVQLDMWSNTEVVTPGGKKTTAREWARELGIFYTPTIILYAPDGREIIRVDSVVQYYRLWGVLDYVNRKGYITEPDYQAWRLKERKVSEK